MELVLLGVVAVAAFAAGVFFGPHITGAVTSVSQSHAVSKAKSLIAAEEARLKALEAAKKVVATAPTGPTGA